MFLGRGVHKVPEFLFVHGRTHHKVGDAAHVRQIVCPVVGGSICTNETSTVETEDHMQVLDGHVVNHLVIGPLHEARVDVAKRNKTTRGHSCAEGYGVLFSNADIEGPVGHFFHHVFQAAPRRHGRCDPYNAAVFFGKLDDAPSKNVLEFGRLGRCICRFQDLSSVLVEQAGSVPLGGASCL